LRLIVNVWRYVWVFFFFCKNTSKIFINFTKIHKIHRVKGIPKDEALIIAMTDNFHGRTISIVSMSTDELAREDFGPFTPGIGAVCPMGHGTGGEVNASRTVPHGDLEALRACLAAHGPRVAAVLLEPIQGEAGVIVPPDDYMPGVRALCDAHNVLMIADEVQSGLGRAGRMAAVDRWNVRPDMIILGKALSGGMYPVSGVVANDAVMGTLNPGSHGSTYGGNPMACAVGTAALDVLIEEGLCERSEVLGERFRSELRARAPEYVAEVRGAGLMNAIEFDESKTDRTCHQFCLLLKERGLLAKPTHGNIVRFSPPLVMTDAELTECIEIIATALNDLPTYDVASLEG
jgi:ornithine--oxo-acid transaminase